MASAPYIAIPLAREYRHRRINNRLMEIVRPIHTLYLYNQGVTNFMLTANVNVSKREVQSYPNSGVFFTLGYGKLFVS